jgi:hypothetical protein
MIQKSQFVKLRKYVLDYLKRSSDGNGYGHIQHGALENTIMYTRTGDFHPFSGMSSYQMEQATDIFWETLLKAKQIEMVMAPVTLSGREGKHYYLPGTKPFHTSTEYFFTAIREQKGTL